MILPRAVITAPTIGLGRVDSSPFSASCMQRRIYFTSSSVQTGCLLSCSIYINRCMLSCCRPCQYVMSSRLNTEIDHESSEYDIYHRIGNSRKHNLSVLSLHITRCSSNSDTLW